MRPLILLVEDNETNQMLALTVLQRDGYRVEVAGSSEEAMQRLAAVRPDPMLMDIQLPGMDGLEFTKELKTHSRTANIPVVALTAHAMPLHERAARAAGCAGFIAKPWMPEALTRDVRGYLAAGSEARR